MKLSTRYKAFWYGFYARPGYGRHLLFILTLTDPVRSSMCFSAQLAPFYEPSISTMRRYSKTIPLSLFSRYSVATYPIFSFMFTVQYMDGIMS